MEANLGPHERYLVVRAKDGWAVNLGADRLITFTNRADAREAAERHAAAAREAGRNADWTDVGEDHPDDMA